MGRRAPFFPGTKKGQEEFSDKGDTTSRKKHPNRMIRESKSAFEQREIISAVNHFKPHLHYASSLSGVT